MNSSGLFASMSDTTPSPYRTKLSLRRSSLSKQQKRGSQHKGAQQSVRTPNSKKASTAPHPAFKPKMKAVLSSRSAAFHILTDIITRHKMLADAMVAHQPLSDLEPRDRNFSRLLIATSLRRHGQITALLDPLITSETDTPTRIILMIGVAQLVFIGTEAHASIDTSVELAKHLLPPRRAGMVNAVLRRLQRELDDRINATNIIDNLQCGLAARWRDAWGADELTKLANHAMAIPPLDIAVKTDVSFWAARLGGQVLNSQIVRCPNLGDIRALPGYDEGAWWVQDVAAALPVQLLTAANNGSLTGKFVLDLCAAPGGKTAQLAAAGAEICAVEKDPARLSLLRDNLNRLSLSADIIEANILDFTPARQADHIILDAPCSATGTFRRHPDIFLRKKGLNLRRLQQTQIDLLKASLNWIKDDGTFIYITCSLQPEEGEEVVQTVLTEGYARLLPFSVEELGIFSRALHPKGWARILPSCLDHINAGNEQIGTGCDGFFIARLQPVRS